MLPSAPEIAYRLFSSVVRGRPSEIQLPEVALDNPVVAADDWPQFRGVNGSAEKDEQGEGDGSHRDSPYMD